MDLREKLLKIRVKKFIDTLGVSKTKFCKNVKIGYSTYFAWMAGNLNLQESTLERIDEYISHFLF